MDKETIKIKGSIMTFAQIQENKRKIRVAEERKKDEVFNPEEDLKKITGKH